MVDKVKVKELLGSGLSIEVVSSAVGCAAAYISELMGDTEFAKDVIELRTQALQSHNRRDKSIDDIEDSLISKVKELVDSGMIYKPRDILQAFRVMNSAQRRGVPAEAGMNITNNIVHLQLPEQLIKGLTITQSGEVVDIELGSGNQTLVTMPTSTLLSQLSSRSDDDAKRFGKVARYLPGAAVAESKKSSG